MVDNQVKVTYDKNAYDLTINFNDNYQDGYCEDDDCDETIYNYISMNLVNDNNFENFKDEYDLFIDNLKENKVYTYNETRKILVE